MAVNQSKAELRKQRIKQEEKKREYEAFGARTRKILFIIFSATLLFSVLALILTLVTDAVFVHNTAMTENRGREVAVSGAAFLKALFTNNYASSGAGYDDIAVPFYYYAKAWCSPAAVLTLFTVLAEILTILFSGLSLFLEIRKKDNRLPLLSLVASAFMTVAGIALYAVCISMADSKILPIYCGGNPACSIQSDLIWCVVLSLIMLAGNIYAVIRDRQLKRMETKLA